MSKQEEARRSIRLFNLEPFSCSMSPSATMNSRFSTPGGRSPNLTPPEGPLVFEKANNVILSCPDGLAHALSEQNIRLQQIIYDHKVSASGHKRV